jgi:probable F420-dependent oxidoreductase
MQFGVMIPHIGPAASPGFIRDFCQAADDLGYASLWSVGHYVLPPRFESLNWGREGAPRRLPDNYLIDLDSPMYEMLSTLLWVAGFTKRARLGTAVAVLPVINPVLNARILATLDAYSGGRLIYGVGVGWLKEEADAMQMPWDHRGERSDEHIALLRRLWTAEGILVDFESKYYRFPPIDPEPRPVQKPPPIFIGGRSEIAVARAGRLGDGWLPPGMSPAETLAYFEKAKRAAAAAGRDPAQLQLIAATHLTLRPGTGAAILADPVADVIAHLRAYRDIGVEHLRLIFEPRGKTTNDIEALRFLAEEVLPAVG